MMDWGIVLAALITAVGGAMTTLSHNCTGFTTLKFPVRVKAKLGPMGLGNVVDLIQVVNHEQLCF